MRHIGRGCYRMTAADLRHPWSALNLETLIASELYFRHSAWYEYRQCRRNKPSQGCLHQLLKLRVIMLFVYANTSDLRFPFQRSFRTFGWIVRNRLILNLEW